MTDKIIRELWQIKDHIASKHNYDDKNFWAYPKKERDEKLWNKLLFKLKIN